MSHRHPWLLHIIYIQVIFILSPAARTAIPLVEGEHGHREDWDRADQHPVHPLRGRRPAARTALVEGTMIVVPSTKVYAFVSSVCYLPCVLGVALSLLAVDG